MIVIFLCSVLDSNDFLFHRMKDLESKLAERDAMIRVLQKHTYDKDSSSSSGVGSYPAAHSSHSSTSADHHTALTSTPELGKKCIFMKKWYKYFKIIN